ncbi:MAG: VWA domain-containing protein [Deltaproteobacteria bacterium]|nr:VWA domain-containing protein [Deltaproteobacteria bacterium]
MRPEQGRVEYKDIPVTVNRNVDILFVIDDSPSMADKQNNLAANFPNFINVLNTIQGGLPDVHIGVVSSDVGSKATQDAAPAPAIGQIGNGGCSGTGKSGNLQTSGAPVTGTFISDIKQTDGSRTKNYTGALDQVFAQMARVGAGGCGFEQHLEAMKRALNNNPANAGFLRPDAYLAVIFIADEDDCTMSKGTLLAPESPAMGPLQSFRCTRFGVTCDQGGQTPDQMNQVGTKTQCHPNDTSQYLEKVSVYVEFLKKLKTDPGKIIVAGIMGTTEPFQTELRTPPGGGTAIQSLAHSCSYTGANGLEVADPPTRIKFLLDQFPNRSTFTSICQQNLSDGLVLIAQLLKSVIGDPCIEGKLADVDPNTPGPQYDCSVSDVTNKGKPNQQETILPPCDANATNKPCWRINTDLMNCPLSDHFTLKIERAQAPAPETHVIANCVTEATDS